MRRCGDNPWSESESRRDIIWVACGIFILALAVRLLYLYESSDNPAFGAPIVDARGYDLIAGRLVTEAKMPEQFFWQQFFYPFFLSAVYLCSNCSVLAAQVVQAVLGGAICVLTFLTGRAVYDRRTGVLAALFVAFCGPLIFHEVDLIAVGWSAFWSLVLILLLLRVVRRRGNLAFFALGLCGALSIITRPNFTPFLAAGVIWAGLVLYKARTGKFSIARYLSLVILGFVVIALPVAIQNRRVTGHFGILPASGGINFYIGNNPDFEAAEIRVGTQWERLTDMPAEHGVIDDMWQKQRFFYEKTWGNVASEPVNFLKGLGVKAMQFACSREIPGDTDIYLFRRWSKVLELLVWKAGAFGFPLGLLLPLALIGLVYNRRKTLIPVILFLVAYPLPIILTHVKTRYRAPMIPVLSILAASGCFYLVRSTIGRKWLGVAGAICLGVVTVILCSLPGPFVAEKLDYEAELYFNVGRTLQDTGKIEEAIKNYTQALKLKPNYGDVHVCLGIILSAGGKSEEAIKHYEKAVESDPKDHRVHCGLGGALYRAGRFDEAHQQFIEAVKLKPHYSEGHKSLGFSFARQQNSEKAIWHYRQALKYAPDDADTHRRLGMILARQGNIDEAVAHLEQATDLRPDFAEAQKALGIALASTGKLDEGCERIRKAVQLQPQDVDGRYFLGVLLAQRGDVDGAVKEFREVLRINPNHAAAQSGLNTLLLKSGDSGARN
ncbi:MAG: tetratricopeptide repeat protein [Planctomycetota bacterium]|jgi:tetratricopeptide (TPR) repeat protein